MPNSLQHLLRRRLESAPAAPALAWYTSSGDLSWTSVEQLMVRASGPAAHLKARGVRPGDVCLIVLPSEESAALLLLAVLQLGAIPLLAAPPLLHGTDDTLRRTLRFAVRRTAARVVLLPSALTGGAVSLKGTQCLAGEYVARVPADGQPPRFERTATDVVAMQLTSGTTGRPRICVWEQRRLLAALAGMYTAMQLGREDVCFNWTPLYHDMGLVNNFLLCLAHGVPLVMLSPFEFVRRPAAWIRGLAESGATVTWSPNFGFALAAGRVDDAELAGVRLDGVRTFWNAAERVHVRTMQEFRARFAPFGLRDDALKTNFGCAENVGGATFSAMGAPVPVEYLDRDLLQRRVASVVGVPSQHPERSVAVVGVGRPYPGLRLQILSPRGQPLPDGRVGEIALDTPSRMSGYLGDAAASRRALRNGLLRTGDLGYTRGPELFWVGRAKERIVLRGRKIDPSDFEPVLLHVPGLRAGSFAAFGVEDAALGTERVVIVAEIREPPSRHADEIVGDINREVFLRVGVNVDTILLVRPGTLTKTSSGKRRHRFVRERYLRGELEAFRFQPPDGGRPRA